MRRVRIVDIAREAEVSPAAVSLVLNGKAGSHVSAPEREKVIALARKYNYRPNLSASNLRKLTRRSIGICMPAPIMDGDSAMLLEQQKYLQQHGCQTLFSFWQLPPESEESLQLEIGNAFEMAFTHNVNGIIAWYYREELKRENIPTVIFGSMHDDFDCVSPDYAGQGDLAVRVLAELGHRDLAYFGYAGLQPKLVRDAILKRGLPFREEWYCVRNRDEESNLAIFSGTNMSRILDRTEIPTGIICHNERFAEGVRTTVIARGLRIPEDISIVTLGMLHSTMQGKLFDTASTDVRRNVKITVDCLFTRMEHPDRPRQAILIQPEYHSFGSCAAPRIEIGKHFS